jgi:hypothetical protein
MFEQLHKRKKVSKLWNGGRYARMRFLEVGERKEQVTACRTEVGLWADTTYAISTTTDGWGIEIEGDVG